MSPPLMQDSVYFKKTYRHIETEMRDQPKGKLLIAAKTSQRILQEI
jgi:hypothetical protein